MSNVQTIDNTSPLIQYKPSAQWVEGDKNQDPEASQYSANGTFTLTTTNGASATFSCNCTGISIFGAKRSNHGPYTVVLDSKKPDTFDGFSAQSQFNVALYRTGPMSPGFHTVTITDSLNNTNMPFLDIDYITWTPAGASTGSTDYTVEDDDTNTFSYGPSNAAWSNDMSSFQGFSQNSGHWTTQENAAITISFSGQAIQVFGAIGPSQSSYTVSMDGVNDSRTFNATKASYASKSLLYAASGLDNGNHVVKLFRKKNGGSDFSSLAVDYAIFTPQDKEGRKLSAGAIAGIVIGAAAFIGIIGALVFFYMRRRRRKSTPVVSLLDPYGVEPSEEAMRERPLLSAEGSSRHPSSSNLPSSQRETYQGAIAPSGRKGGNLHVVSPSTEENSSTNGEPSYVPDRLVVPGRAQDLGPALLPPDYDQATQPWQSGEGQNTSPRPIVNSPSEADSNSYSPNAQAPSRSRSISKPAQNL